MRVIFALNGLSYSDMATRTLEALCSTVTILNYGQVYDKMGY